MAKTQSTMLPLGTTAPTFCLSDATGKIYDLEHASRQHIKSEKNNHPPLLVMFICNHCPYVIHIRSTLARLTSEFIKQGVQVIAINSNDVKMYPQDNLENMNLEQKTHGYQFPYLLDATQEIAKAYRAACTPDFFLFDQQRKLSYRGQMDASRPGNGIVNDGCDLKKAVEHVLNDSPPIEKQIPSLGCNIKWKPGNEPTAN